ncbi:MAG: substrate-binding domain-containing protein [Actinomycetia bacterium]|nr:substrate-binding domain-containing protein [Actinomycetes bacterium]
MEGLRIASGLRLVLAALLVAAITLVTASCASGNSPVDDPSTLSKQPRSADTIRLATSAFTKDSGLLNTIIPDFEQQTGYSVSVVAVGSGEAMQLGKSGGADVLLTYSSAAEKEFIESGNADPNGGMDVMYNDFVLIGPKNDPAGIAEKYNNNAAAAFKYLANNNTTFISHVDNSGISSKEMQIWEKADIVPRGRWHVVGGDDIGASIILADEQQAYTLAYRETWLSISQKTDLRIVCEKDPSGILNNQYSVICVNPNKGSNINYAGAQAFQQWITSDKTQKLIGQFGMSAYGQQLFAPNAKSPNPE